MDRLLKKLSYDEELDNLRDDNTEIYKIIEDKYLQIIDYKLGDIEGIIDYKDESDNIKECCNSIIDNAYCVMQEISNAKDNGIRNEDTLYKGKDIIKKLEGALDEYKEQLDELESQHSELEDQVNDLNFQVENVKNEINDKIEAEKIHGKTIESERSYAFICNAHDAIINQANNIKRYTETFKDEFLARFEDYSNEQMENTINDYVNDCNNCISIINDALNQAIDMNERMGKGIDDKNETIQDINNQISELENQLDEKRVNIEELEDTIKELTENLQNIDL